MPRLVWDNFPRLNSRLLELDYQSVPHDAIASTLNDEYSQLGVAFTEDMVRNRLKRLSRVSLIETPEPILMPLFEKYRSVVKGDDPAPEKVGLPNMSEGLRRILYYGDPHIPYQNDRVIEAAIQANLTADLVVIGGDLFDAYALSSYEKHENVPFELEIEGMIRHFEYLVKVYPNTPVLILGGNHHKRVRRNVQYPMALSFLYDVDFCDAITRPFPTIRALGQWYWQVGDVLFAHDEQASAVDVKAAVTAYSWFTEMKEQLGLDPFRVVLQAHTHGAGVAYRYDKKIIEAGCTCVPMAYAFNSSKYKRPQVNAWATLVLQDGKCVLNDSREHVYFGPRSTYREVRGAA